MSRNTSGFVLLHRSILTSAIANDPYAVSLFVMLIAMANWEDSRLRGEIIRRGQLVTGIDELATLTGIPRASVQRKLVKLSELQMLRREVRHDGSLITILNYDKYQLQPNDGGTQVETQVRHSWDTSETQAVPSNELNKLNKENKDTLHVDSPESTPTPRELSEIWNANKAPVQPEVRQEMFKPGSKRWTWAKSRLSEKPDLGYWTEVVKRIAASPFCKGEGQTRDTPWVADFEFLVRKDTHVKVLEGKYDPRGQVQALGETWVQRKIREAKEQEERDRKNA